MRSSLICGSPKLLTLSMTSFGIVAAIALKFSAILCEFSNMVVAFQMENLLYSYKILPPLLRMTSFASAFVVSGVSKGYQRMYDGITPAIVTEAKHASNTAEGRENFMMPFDGCCRLRMSDSCWVFADIYKISKLPLGSGCSRHGPWYLVY